MIIFYLVNFFFVSLRRIYSFNQNEIKKMVIKNVKLKIKSSWAVNSFMDIYEEIEK